MEKWKLLETKRVLENKYMSVDKNIYKRSDGKIIDGYYKVNRGDFVVIFAVDNNKNVVMEWQYRVGADEILLELPAGFIDKGEKPIEAGLRELQEETGYIGKNPKYHGSYYVSAGFTGMKAHIVSCEINKRKDIKNLDPNEEIEVELMPLKEVYKKAKSREIKDFSALVAIELYKDLGTKN